VRQQQQQELIKAAKQQQLRVMMLVKTPLTLPEISQSFLQQPHKQARKQLRQQRQEQQWQQGRPAVCKQGRCCCVWYG